MLRYKPFDRNLICVIRQGRLEKVRELLNIYGLSYSEAGGYLLLCCALEKKHVAIAKLLLKRGSRVNKKDNKLSNTPLHFAVMGGDIEIVKMLLDKGANIDVKNEGGRTPLHNATQYKKMEVTELLLKHRANVNATDSDGTSPLHFAVINGDIEIVKMILDKGANIDAKDRYGRTPLHNATEYKKMGVTELLLKHGADVNAIDNDGRSPLLFAAETGCLQIVEHLLKYGAYVNCVCTSRSIMYPIFSKRSVLHIAVEKGNKEVVALLLSRNAIVDVKGKDSITPLHIAAKKGYVHIAEDLLHHGAYIHSLTLNKGYTPLHFASKLGNEETVKLFLNRGADINASTKDNLTPLYIATKKGHKTVVNLLLQRGAEVDIQDKDGKTILYLAVEKGYLTIVEDILKYCPDINNKSNKNSLKIAVYGFGQEDKKIVEALLEYGLIVNPKDANNPELLHAAIAKGYLRIVEDLLKYGADVNLIFKKGFTPLHSAAKNKQEEVAKLLISYEADINAEDETGKTPIFYAIESTDLKITKLLLTNRANIKGSPELLNIAVQKECIEIVEVLLQHDADINASDNSGRTALHFTAMSENEGVSRFDTSEDTNEDIKGEIAKLLLSKGANVDAETKYGFTTLQAAIDEENVKLVKALLKYNANVNCRQVNTGLTPLHLSVLKGNEEITLMLLNKGANVNAKLRNSSATALHLATKYGYQELVKVLLEFGANVDSKITDDITPLHLGAINGFSEIIETLLKFGADINITCRNSHTPLDYAMNALRLFYEHLILNPQDLNCHPGARSFKETVEALEHHVVKMKTANLYVSEKNLKSMTTSDKISDFQLVCEEEIASMKSEKINNTNISYYNILVKDTSSLAAYMRNENIVQVLKSNLYKIKFPIYARMIVNNFKKGMERKKLLEQGNNILHFHFNNLYELSYNCSEKIVSYLSVEDLRILIDTCKPLSINDPNANVSDVMID